MRIPAMLCVIALSGSVGEAAFAHHSFAAFDMKKEVRISGKISEVQYTNPHTWIFVDVAGLGSPSNVPVIVSLVPDRVAEAEPEPSTAFCMATSRGTGAIRILNFSWF